jgi:hypothetical protein
MRSRRSGCGWPLGDTTVSGRRVTRKAPLAHVEGGSGRSEASPTAILQDTHSVEGELHAIHHPAYEWGSRSVRVAERVHGSGTGTHESRRWTKIDTFLAFACYCSQRGPHNLSSRRIFNE